MMMLTELSRNASVLGVRAPPGEADAAAVRGYFHTCAADVTRLVKLGGTKKPA